ncbi:MAG: bifunctional phosphopantothenoylcysteine decarboxylase/phosphopantothenate--cysteine ligase CoaBC [Actinomycetota bacterium]
MTERHPRVVVGLTGGIAAYKVVSVIRDLVTRGWDVHVVPTESALNFIGRATLEAISRNPVYDTIFDGVAEVRHVALGQSADVILIAPATANTLSALATGRADSLLLTSVLASRAPLVVAPAMHTEMWENSATVANVAVLRDRGVRIVGPAVGRLTGADTGIGRLEEPSQIVDAVESALIPDDLSGVSVVITVGGTREPLDPVRFIGNRSTGIQGFALARAAAQRGARVTMIVGTVETEIPAGMTCIRVETAQQMHDAVLDAARDAQVVIMAAAVADYRAETVSSEKLKKSGGVPTITLVENPDILADLTARPEGRFIVGFAAETDSERFHEYASAKAVRKRADILVANSVGADSVFGTAETHVSLYNRDGVMIHETAGSKTSVAHAILDHISRWKATQQ